MSFRVDPNVARSTGQALATYEQAMYLRRTTGEGLMACKKALEAHPDDLIGAREHLRCEGQAVVRRGANARRPCGCPIHK